MLYPYLALLGLALIFLGIAIAIDAAHKQPDTRDELTRQSDLNKERNIRWW